MQEVVIYSLMVIQTESTIINFS